MASKIQNFQHFDIVRKQVNSTANGAINRFAGISFSLRLLVLCSIYVVICSFVLRSNK